MIFCVEDDREIRDLMLYALGSAGFEARGFADGEAFFRGLEEARPEHDVQHHKQIGRASCRERVCRYV